MSRVGDLAASRPAIALRALGCALALALALGAPAVATAAAPGGITQLPLPLGCLSNGGAGGCTAMHDSAFPFGFVLSSDGRNAYAASFGGNQLLIFDRDGATGALRQKDGTAGCVQGAAATATCASARFLSGAQGLAIAPDGRHLYVASTHSNAILVFERDTATGAIAQKAADGGCIADANPQCADARALGGPYNLAISPDGKNVYSVAYTSAAITALSVNADGSLRQTADGGGYGCVADVATADCAAGRALGGPYYVTVSPDGRTVYAATFSDASVVALDRNTATGAMTPLAGATGCVDRDGTSACTTLPELGNVRYLTMNDTGSRLYAGTEGGRVVVLDRQAAGTITRHPGVTGCLAGGAVAGCTQVRGLAAGNGIALSPGGDHAYVAGSTALVEYAVGADGGLTPRPGTTACISVAATADCAAGTAMAGVYGVGVSPDGRFVYTSDTGNNNLQAFRRDSAGPACGSDSVTVTSGTQTTLQLPCSDVDGDAFDVAIVAPPTLGALGAIDQPTHKVVYAAPQGQTGLTTVSFRGSYGGFDSQLGSVAITVVAPPAPDAGAAPAGGGGTPPGGSPTPLVVAGKKLPATLGAGWRVKGAALTLTRLRLGKLPAGARVQARCSGPRCPFAQRTLKGKVTAGKLDLLKALGTGRALRAGQTFELRVSAPGFTTAVFRFALKAGSKPAASALCLPAGAAKPAACS